MALSRQGPVGAAADARTSANSGSRVAVSTKRPSIQVSPLPCAAAYSATAPVMGSARRGKRPA